LWSERRKSLQRRWPAVVVPVLHGFVLMLPILLGDLLHPHGDLFAGSIWVTVFSVELVLYAVGTVFVIFMLVSERTVTAHKTAASMDPLTGMLQPSRLCRGDIAGDRARGQCRPSGHGDDLRHRSFQIDQRPASAIRPATRFLNYSPPSSSIRFESPICRGESAARNSQHCCPVHWKKP